MTICFDRRADTTAGNYQPGERIDLPEDEAFRLISLGIAHPASDNDFETADARDARLEQRELQWA